MAHEALQTALQPIRNARGRAGFFLLLSAGVHLLFLWGIWSRMPEVPHVAMSRILHASVISGQGVVRGVAVVMPAPAPPPAIRTSPRKSTSSPTERPRTMPTPTAASSPQASTGAAEEQSGNRGTLLSPGPSPTASGEHLRDEAARHDAAYLNNPPPEYPLLSRRRREEGTVFLRVSVSAVGDPEGAEIEKSSGFSRLDEAALAAVRHWKFSPARQRGVPFASSVRVPVRFSLE